MTAPTLPLDTGWMGDRRRGASMGRVDKPSTLPATPRKFNLRRVRINSGGYDSGGAYWGIGAPLYWASTVEGETEFFFRAPGRAAAKNEVCKRHPGATFAGRR